MLVLTHPSDMRHAMDDLEVLEQIAWLAGSGADGSISIRALDSDTNRLKALARVLRPTLEDRLPVWQQLIDYGNKHRWDFNSARWPKDGLARLYKDSNAAFARFRNDPRFASYEIARAKANLALFTLSEAIGTKPFNPETLSSLTLSTGLSPSNGLQQAIELLAEAEQIALNATWFRQDESNPPRVLSDALMNVVTRHFCVEARLTKEVPHEIALLKASPESLLPSFMQNENRERLARDWNQWISVAPTLNVSVRELSEEQQRQYRALWIEARLAKESPEEIAFLKASPESLVPSLFTSQDREGLERDWDAWVSAAPPWVPGPLDSRRLLEEEKRRHRVRWIESRLAIEAGTERSESLLAGKRAKLERNWDEWAGFVVPGEPGPFDVGGLTAEEKLHHRSGCVEYRLAQEVQMKVIAKKRDAQKSLDQKRTALERNWEEWARTSIPEGPQLFEMAALPAEERLHFAGARVEHRLTQEALISITAQKMGATNLLNEKRTALRDSWDEWVDLAAPGEPGPFTMGGLTPSARLQFRSRLVEARLAKPAQKQMEFWGTESARPYIEKERQKFEADWNSWTAVLPGKELPALNVTVARLHDPSRWLEFAEDEKQTLANLVSDELARRRQPKELRVRRAPQAKVNPQSFESFMTELRGLCKWYLLPGDQRPTLVRLPSQGERLDWIEKETRNREEWSRLTKKGKEPQRPEVEREWNDSRPTSPSEEHSPFDREVAILVARVRLLQGLAQSLLYCNKTQVIAANEVLKGFVPPGDPTNSTRALFFLKRQAEELSVTLTR